MKHAWRYFTVLLITQCLAKMAYAKNHMQNHDCSDFSISLPNSSRFSSDMARFLVTSQFLPSENRSEELLIPCHELSEEALSVIQQSMNPDRTIDLNSLRQLIGPQYLDHRSVRHASYTLPDKLEEFLRDTKFKSWPTRVIPLSQVKGLTRVIYDSPPESKWLMSVSQTLDSTTGDLSAPHKETEILWKREGEGPDWDFYAYSQAGNLSLTSEFRGRALPSPVVCISCHYDPDQKSFRPRSRPEL